tara:strand:- start:12079 stop:12690 length:612 start_codon:yes stop_codon:yes gene_type:complete
MANTVEICNLAIAAVGGNLIMSLEDNSVEARVCKANFAAARDKCLEDRDWTFATSRKELAPLAQEPVFGYDGLFKLPSDCIRVIEAFDKSQQTSGPYINEQDRPNPLAWSVEEGNIAADATEGLLIRYIKRIEDPSRFSAGFTQVLAHYLAYLICVPLAKSRALRNDTYSLYERALDDASIGDGLQGRSQLIRSSKLIRARTR